MTSSNTKKRQPRRTVEVNYYDPATGEFLGFDLITAAPFAKWGEIAELQKLILEMFVEVGGTIGELFGHEKFLSVCEQLSKLIPVIGEKRPFDFKALVDADDWPQIVRLFVTTLYDEAGNPELDEKGNPVLVKPGIIADLHNLNFLRTIVTLEEERQKRLEREAESTEVADTTKSI